MDVLERLLASHPRTIRLGWITLLAVLAACNPGDNSGGGGVPY